MARGMRPRLLVLALGAAFLLAGCGSEQSTLSPASHPAHEIERLWWFMMAGAWVVFGGALAFLVIAWLRRSAPGWPLIGEREGFNVGLVVFFGMGVPVVVLTVLFAFANFHVMAATRAPAQGSTALTVEVVGHQWWWEVRYPRSGAVTANEIHIPAKTRVALEVKTADVIHSFWIPELNRKIDMIPGRTSRILLYADKPGVYRGQCSEFCGLQHAHMGLEVVADPPQRFQSWLANMAGPARSPSGSRAMSGRNVFLSQPCAGCHTIRGTDAAGRLGPDLTHLADRSTIAALTVPNDRAHLAEWIVDPQHLKPGNKMPALNLSNAQLDDLLAYLESLK
ncbi:MAG TPA: cytochrome c oxidase subunit II [Gaiellaceae bacterium]|nr:cytochrome c oxidase subunit II [Gaiellaceae bacterium]